MTKEISEVAQDLDLEDSENGDSEQIQEPVENSETTSRKGIKDMLMSTSPCPNLEEVESPFNPEMGEKRLMRAFQKMTDSDGMPAIMEVFISVLEIAIKHNIIDKEGGQE